MKEYIISVRSEQNLDGIRDIVNAREFIRCKDCIFFECYTTMRSFTEEDESYICKHPNEKLNGNNRCQGYNWYCGDAVKVARNEERQMTCKNCANFRKDGWCEDLHKTVATNWYCGDWKL